MGATVDDGLVAAVVAMHPWVRSRPEGERAEAALRALVEAEACRRGAPDPVSGALHVTALTQGALLKPEFDLSVHAHTGWTVGAVIADVKEMIHVNQGAGFALGDRFLRAVASALAGAFPGAPVVRVHTDCFAALLLPSSGLELEASALGRATEALARAAEDFRAPSTLPGFTVSALRLSIVDPSHWQVLGPLLWAEIERAHVIARRGLGTAEGPIQERALRLDGRVPAPPTPRG
ncbi:MAG: GGDEF domain-containing protein [Myxococcaceae bacterium]